MRKLILIPFLALTVAACGDDPATSPETPLDAAQPVLAVSTAGIGITDLGADTKAWAINDAGHIVGERYSDAAIRWKRPYRQDDYAVLWTSPAASPQAAAYAINSRSQVVGYSNDGTTEVGMLYDRKATELRGMTGYDRTSAWAVNDRGQVAGVGANEFPYSSTAIIWDDLKPRPLEAEEGDCWARGINMAGEVVGDCGAGVVAVFWEAGTTRGTPLDRIRDLPHCLAYDINDKGQIVGVCHSGPNDPYPPKTSFAVLWENGKEVRQWEGCWAFSINIRGHIAMTCWGEGTPQAFLYDGATEILLGSLDEKLAFCWAYGINDRDKVVGLCRPGFDDEGNHAVVWEP